MIGLTDKTSALEVADKLALSFASLNSSSFPFNVNPDVDDGSLGEDSQEGSWCSVIWGGEHVRVLIAPPPLITSFAGGNGGYTESASSSDFVSRNLHSYTMSVHIFPAKYGRRLSWSRLVSVLSKAGEEETRRLLEEAIDLFAPMTSKKTTAGTLTAMKCDRSHMEDPPKKTTAVFQP
ncbi:hypothetical protein HYPSUDRAFT_55085 [Hypholoma sublateritium FD-334 SS-4]|uniref:Uncharacterized protein n=1 Tax=Hypholoma sublateritium (strain FD-334 SS-4) TaxID=945553 RepID=A0A0D2PQV5_HYPSF|nr:hypothetical protein HYPSUDRAFT_55085 [Hypholoma sublateritium FD-334 SS-4]